MGIFTECARCDLFKDEVKLLKAEIERLQAGERAADAEISRLQEENGQWSRACADYTAVLAAQDRRIAELLEDITRVRDQIAKHNLAIREAIRRGEAFEWKTLTLDS